MSLKRFEILEMIAKGGMAEVYRAKTTGFSGFEKEVCVKKILPFVYSPWNILIYKILGLFFRYGIIEVSIISHF